VLIVVTFGMKICSSTDIETDMPVLYQNRLWTELHGVWADLM